jgi:dihydrofolate reductase
MRKVILMMPVSADGFIEGPEHEPDWHKVDDELHRHFNEQPGAMGAFLMGRVTDELIAGVWPTLGSRETWPVCGLAGHNAAWPPGPFR